MRPLKIALIAPPWFAVPPERYGGIEWVVSILADGLVARGHEVTLFASGGSTTGAELVTTYAEPPSAALGDWMVEAAHVLGAYDRWRDFDIIHDHTLLGSLCGSFVSTPIVHTIHSKITGPIAGIYGRVADRLRLVAISEHQRSTLPDSCQATVIYNGVDPSRFPFGQEPEDYLLFVGRMSPEKGILPAIEIAKAAGRQLLVLGKVNEPDEREYFDSEVKSRLLAAGAEYLEQPPHAVKAEAYRNAYATLFPIQWPEPFGMVMAESMVAGTPVIAFRNGSVPEVIADGRTGFICDSIGEAVDAVARVPEISRSACHEHVMKHFSAERNVLRHEELYQRLVTTFAEGGSARLSVAAPLL